MDFVITSIPIDYYSTFVAIYLKCIVIQNIATLKLNVDFNPELTTGPVIIKP